MALLQEHKHVFEDPAFDGHEGDYDLYLGVCECGEVQPVEGPCRCEERKALIAKMQERGERIEGNFATWRALA